MANRRPTDSPRPSTVGPTPAPTPTASESTSAAPAPAARKPRAPRAKKATTPSAPPPIEISEDARRAMIAEAAYLRAERRGFTGGSETEREDWLLAEAEVDALLKAGHGGAAQ